jgi:hypothetical protein
MTGFSLIRQRRVNLQSGEFMVSSPRTRVLQMKLLLKVMLLSLSVLSLFAGCSGGSGSSVNMSNPLGIGGNGGGDYVTLSWAAPKSNEDGSPLNDLKGYKIYYGTSSRDYAYSIDVGIHNGVAIASVSLSPGIWYFAVTAYDISGNESDYSNEITRQI